jgi:CBS-domain-containing membrane protein
MNDNEQNSIKAKFIKLWPFYSFQSLLASLALGAIVLAIGKENMVSIGAMAATTFIVFAMPKAASARSRNILGGHITGLICGAAFFYLVPLPYFIQYPLTVGVAIFLMVTLDFEHPPAAGTALAVVTHEVTWQVFIVILVSALVFSLIHSHFNKYLRDLV